MIRATTRLATRSLVHDPAVVIRLPEAEYGSLDLRKLTHVRRRLLREAERLAQPLLIVDFSAVQSFGATFAGILVSLWNVLRRRDRRLILCELTPYCAGLIKNLSLDRLFDILPTQQAALESFRQNDAHTNGTAAGAGIRIEKTEVAWDPHMERWDYLDDDGRSIQTVIVRRPEQWTEPLGR